MSLNALENLKLSLTMFNLGGFNPRITTTRSKFFKILGLFSSICVLSLNIASYIFEENTLTSFAEKVESTVTIFQVVLKTTLLTYYGKDILDLLEMCESFWKVENIDENLRKEIANLMKEQSRVGKMYLYSVCITLTGFLSKVFLPGNEMPMKAYMFDNGPICFILIFFLQVITMCYIEFVVIPLDVFFSALCLQAVVQLKILGYKIKTIQYENSTIYQEKFIKYIKYFDFLLK